MKSIKQFDFSLTRLYTDLKDDPEHRERVIKSYMQESECPYLKKWKETSLVLVTPNYY